MPLVYTVTAALPSLSLRDEYIAWLMNGHIQAVVSGGATSARVIRIDEPDAPLKARACYTFPDRAAFQTYLKDHAPALRADGQRRFPPTSGVTFERQVGMVVGAAP